MAGTKGNDTSAFAEEGNVIEGGGDNAILRGGPSEDRIVIVADGQWNQNTTVIGGSGGQDHDILDLSELLQNGWLISYEVQNPDFDGNGYSGQIGLSNAETGEYANINYDNIEEFVVCFTPGSGVATVAGIKPVETLRPGDRVITRDNGIQEIAWVASKDLSSQELYRQSELAPILIRKEALGRNSPVRDMLVSPQHRVLIRSDLALIYFEEREVLVAAKDLVGWPGVSRAYSGAIRYIHFMCQHHEIVLSDGIWTESFQPGAFSLAGLEVGARKEIFTLFPELQQMTGLDSYRAARMSLKSYEAQLLRAS
nr:Hint domain-containing protein [uncultured Celeribacter sp.]